MWEERSDHRQSMKRNSIQIDSLHNHSTRCHSNIQILQSSSSKFCKDLAQHNQLPHKSLSSWFTSQSWGSWQQVVILGLSPQKLCQWRKNDHQWQIKLWLNLSLCGMCGQVGCTRISYSAVVGMLVWHFDYLYSIGTLGQWVMCIAHWSSVMYCHTVHIFRDRFGCRICEEDLQQS